MSWTMPALLAIAPTPLSRPAPVDALATLPEEEVWLASLKSPQTRRVYAQDIQHFCRALGITSRDELRRVTRPAVIAWARSMREVQRLHPVTIRRRLSALSSLFTHLVRYGVIAHNPVQAVERPAINRWQGMTPAFTPQQARALLEAPDLSTIPGLRDRALLSVGLQVGLRCSEIVRLTVGDVLTTQGCDALRLIRKGGKRDIIAIHPETAQRLRAYLKAAGHAEDRAGPLFRPMSVGRSPQPIRRHLHPNGVDAVVEKFVTQLGLGHGYSSHSMRATFITTALANGAKLEDVQRTVGHADPATTQLYDRGRFTPQKSAALVVNYGRERETSLGDAALEHA